MIKNLPNRLNAAGNIKIGVKGKEITSKEGNVFRPPQRLDHFILTTTERDESGDFVIDEKLMQSLKEKGGIVNSAGNLVGIPIRLLYEDINLNFPTRYVSYVSGKLSCTGDGVESTKRLDNFEKKHPCPCDRLNPEYDKKDKCKASGKLTVIIDNANLFGQCHVFRTTSINSVMGIMGGLNLIRTATKGHIAGVPLYLVVNNKTTTIPGQGSTTTVQVVSVCYRGSMEDLRDATIKLIEQDKQFLIGMSALEKEAYVMGQDAIITPDEEADFVDEFMPDARAMQQQTKPEPAPEVVPEVVETMPVEQPVKQEKRKRTKKEPVENVEPKTFDEQIKTIEKIAFPDEPEPTDTTPPVDEKYQYDTGPEITREQKIQLVHIKKDELEKVKNYTEKTWQDILARFKNKDRQPIKSATEMTQKQAEELVRVLYNEILNKDIPF
jgi:hypothetical protein